ncbi:metal-dependent hydrolase [Aquibacillus koreensis]|uniref:Metal-dependent hydrolase n=1 Tax=Aquibacillus koreensis TaxID=279446 RepID=A0A9X3WP07_9BACI|nr:metal-dependent hydrolase [Aquibacillus koreensis]MCT2534379.1 metal-dependent hydrolase [Aquibacillus koreensis]MDC3421686.1 metal-dependent hydrolase [Aquibacillus koreensis]
MDTGTHIVMGVALGGLATLDPVVANDNELFQAILIGTVVGSHAPDFDTVLKLKNNAVYLRHHRGITHSMPAVVLWGIAIPSLIHAFMPEVSFFHLWLWSFIAVILHVFVDVFNAYGTQAYRPFTRRWVAYGFINTFDPYIFGLHVIGILAWMFGANPGYTWIIIYMILALYYVKRYLDKRSIVKKIHQKYPDVVEIATSPTLKQNYWRLAITTDTHLFAGRAVDGQIEIVDEFERVPLPQNKVMEIAQQDKNVSAFLSFSPVYNWEINMYDDFTEVRFIDLRYRSRDYYPFVAVVQVDDNDRIMNSYTGWIFSEKKLQSKLLVDDPSLL